MEKQKCYIALGIKGAHCNYKTTTEDQSSPLNDSSGTYSPALPNHYCQKLMTVD